MAKNIIIVGGGMSGLATARFLADDPNNKITIIEKSHEFGGLYTSTRSKSGYTFDHGSHTVLNTGIEELDNILFEDFKDDEWDVIEGSLKETVYYKGEHTDNTVCPDARKLPSDLYAKGLAEFMALEPISDEPKNLQDMLDLTYGKTFAQHLIRPIIEKFYSGDFQDLDPKMYKDFLPLSRIILFNDAMTERLKSIPFFDDRIAWTNFQNGNSTIKKYFSKNGGVGVWPELIEKRVRGLGVTMLNNQSVKAISHKDGHISHVTLEDGQHIMCDELIWTIPAFACLQAAGLPLPKSEKPILLQSIIYNFVFDKALLKDDHWIFNYDKDMNIFRVTLYPNLTASKIAEAPHHLTIEVLRHIEDVPQNLDSLWETLFSEAVKMGLVSSDTAIIDKFCYLAQGARPIPTLAFKAAQKAQIESAKIALKNLRLYGRGNGSHFMNPLLREIWFDLKNISSNPELRPQNIKAA